MNSSGGFQNPSLLGSSTGFKKRNLLRPPSGVLSKKQEFLRSVDISQSEPMIATFLRGQVASIEEEINLMDKDKKLRQGEGGLQKGYVTALRKWLRENQVLNEKEDDDIKILKHMGVDSYESGFRKLWKVVGHLDLAVTKISELQVIHFLLYDEMFDSFGRDSHRSANLLSQISSNSYAQGSFQITQIILDRLKDVYAECKKGGGHKGSKEQYSSYPDKKSREETNQLISQLKAENAKLNSLLEELSMQKEQQKEIVQEKKVVEKEKEGEKSSVASFKELEEKYQQQMRYLNSQKVNAQYAVTELKVKVSSLESQLKAVNSQASESTSFVAKSGSYEQALMEQMQKMKRGFEKKISVLTEEFMGREREVRKKEMEYKSENEKIKWEKSLLLKKFELLTK